MWAGNGEWIWRPLTNPTGVAFNAYSDDNPRGFGLLQRDRDFDHYQDDGVFYERRPSVWVEPKSGWGKGSVQLVELPTVDETSDNIVAFWNPQARPQAGQELLYSYRLHWGTQMPANPPLAQVVATRTGIGGVIRPHAEIPVLAVCRRLRGRRSGDGRQRCEGRTRDQRVAWRDRDYIRATTGFSARISRDV